MTAQIDAAYHSDDAPVVYEIDADEYHDAVENTLAELGYTREQLAQMAADRDFGDPLAFMAWQMIRGDADAT